jgi:5'-nucleotidase
MIARLLRVRAIRAGLIATGLGAVLAAPLAVVGAAPASAVTIGGARTLSDQVSVSWTDDDGKGKPVRTTDLHVLAWNDFHGNLAPASLNIYGHFAGGAAYLAKLAHDKQAQYGHRQVSVLAGDNIGASPLANGLFHEEPATIVTNLMNVDFASVGNHEFDKGSAELKRIQRGGCSADGCTGAPYALRNGGTTDVYPGADFRYLSANVIDTASGRTLFPATGAKWMHTNSGRWVGLGFIGEVLKETPTIVTPSGVAGLSFTDEADAANAAARKLARHGVKVPILVIHQGGFQSPGSGTPNGCNGNLAGSPIEAIAQRLDPSIKVIISGHTHAEYRCTITTNGVTRLITSAASFGRILSDLTLTVNDRTGELVSAAATNSIVDNALNAPGPGVIRQDDPSKADPRVAAVVKQYVDASAPLANRVIGKVQGDLLSAGNALGESALGDVIADAQLAATSDASKGAAVVAFMNPGGIRADIRTTDISGGEAVGEVTYGEAFTVQPFGNSLVTKTLTGDMLRRLLQQQFPGCGGQTVQRVLQISDGFTYESKPAGATCADKIGVIKVKGAVVNPTDTFRVTMNSFLATGGDGFTVFNEGTSALGGAQDIDALADYLTKATAANPAGLPVPPVNRITPLP